MVVFLTYDQKTTGAQKVPFLLNFVRKDLCLKQRMQVTTLQSSLSIHSIIKIHSFRFFIFGLLGYSSYIPLGYSCNLFSDNVFLLPWCLLVSMIIFVFNVKKGYSGNLDVCNDLALTKFRTKYFEITQNSIMELADTTNAIVAYEGHPTAAVEAIFNQVVSSGTQDNYANHNIDRILWLFQVSCDRL